MSGTITYGKEIKTVEKIQRILNNESIVNYTCYKKEDFWDIIHNRTTDLVILEITEEEDFQFLAEWKISDFNYIPVIVITFLNDTKIKIKAFENGVVDYILAPIDNLELIARIKNHLKIKNLQDTLKKYSKKLEHMVQERTVEVEETRNVTIFALARLAESRDPETGKHLERMSHYSKEIAQYLKDNHYCQEQINEKFVEYIFRCSPLHDIGKVGINDNILLKPGKLSSQEFDEMKKHTVIGGKTLEETEKKLKNSNFLRFGKEIAYFHHEKYDGSGYPYGLKQEEIPLSARIVALADVYDALTSKRVYKPVFSHEKAKEIILEGRATHFDPMIVDAFLASEEKFIQIQGTHKDDWVDESFAK